MEQAKQSHDLAHVQARNARGDGTCAEIGEPRAKDTPGNDHAMLSRKPDVVAEEIDHLPEELPGIPVSAGPCGSLVASSRLGCR